MLGRRKSEQKGKNLLLTREICAVFSVRAYLEYVAIISGHNLYKTTHSFLLESVEPLLEIMLSYNCEKEISGTL